MNTRHEEEEKENGERWLLTYSDLITLLLAFFIILFAISNVDKNKYLQVIQSLGEVFGDTGPGDQSGGQSGDLIYPVFTPHSSEMPSGGAARTPSATGGSLGNTGEVEAMENVKAQLEGLLAQEHLGNDVSVTLRSQGLVITVNTKLLFDKGSAELSDSAKKLVEKLAKILTPLSENEISIEGHTDNDPINTTQYPSNWELSSARANTVLKLLLASNKELSPKRMSSRGYGEYAPVAPNDTEANMSKNRRVNIVILKDSISRLAGINSTADNED